MKSRIRSNVFSGFLVLVLVVLSPSPGWCRASDDWMVSVDTKMLKNCLAYPNSDLQPVIKATVNYKNFLRKKEKDQPPKPYEDIYYSHGRVLGLRRHNILDIEAGSPGSIHVSGSSSDFRSEEASASADSVLRLFLDLYVKRTPLTGVVVPRDFFDTLVAELQRHGFRPSTNVLEHPMSALVMVHIISDPVGRKQDLFYGN